MTFGHVTPLELVGASHDDGTVNGTIQFLRSR